MLYWFFAGLFILAQFDRQSYVLAQDVVFECKAWGDPHLETWRLKGTPVTAEQKQDCYAAGKMVLLSNKFVRVLGEIDSARYIIALVVELFDGSSAKPFLTIDPSVKRAVPLPGFNSVQMVYAENPQGSTLTLYYVAEYVYPITIIIQYLANVGSGAFNVQITIPQDLVSETIGQCTKNDKACGVARALDLAEDSQKQTFTFTEAYGICQTYINAYLNLSPQKQTLLITNSVDSVMNGCVADVMFTGDPTVAQSGLGALMLGEVTSSETSVDRSRTTLESRINDASNRLDKAVKEAQMKVARFF